MKIKKATCVYHFLLSGKKLSLTKDEIYKKILKTTRFETKEAYWRYRGFEYKKPSWTLLVV